MSADLKLFSKSLNPSLALDRRSYGGAFSSNSALIDFRYLTTPQEFQSKHFVEFSNDHHGDRSSSGSHWKVTCNNHT